MAPSPASYAWLFDLLYARGSTVKWAAAGKLPPGFQRAEQFAVLRAGPGRSFMVSLAARPGTSSALTSYNALRPARKRLARGALGLGLRAGLVQPLLRTRIDIGTAAGATREQLTSDLLTEHLHELIGCGPVMVAFGGGGGPYRKPVLQIFGADGTPRGYLKVGWNDWTRDAVRREAKALLGCAAHPIRLGVPELLSHSQWQGIDLLLTAPLPGRVRRVVPGPRFPDAGLIREISSLAPGHAGELAASPWWLGLRGRIDAGIADAASRARLALVADRIEQSHGQVPLEFGAWHGDLVPWNMAALDGRLYAWDWECSAPDAPVGFDALHYHFQVAFVARQRPLADAADLARRHAGPVLGALGIAAEARDLVATLHLVELFVRHEEARSSAGVGDDRFYPAVASLLERLLADGREPAGCQERAG
jgi:hypothetical protein